MMSPDIEVVEETDNSGCPTTSLQNVQYHLDQLCEAGVIEVIDTSFSEKETQMAVYALVADPLVLHAGASTSETLLH